jgi:hypothetical protein
MEFRSFADLITPDERTLRFTPLGLSTAGMLKPEAAAEFQQLTIASADLIEAVPDSVRQSFERLRTCHSYGVLWYDAFTVAWRGYWAEANSDIQEISGVPWDEMTEQGELDV